MRMLKDPAREPREAWTTSGSSLPGEAFCPLNIGTDILIRSWARRCSAAGLARHDPSPGDTHARLCLGVDILENCEVTGMGGTQRRGFGARDGEASSAL
jgi:hypothetical protein